MIQDQDFPTFWRSTYWFPSNKVVSDEPSTYNMKSYLKGDELVLESLPNEEGSYMLIRLKVDNGVAVGDWHETTSPTGEFEGAQYSGSGQLVISPDTYYMEGMWVGAGYDRKLKQMRIYSGNWQIEPQDALEFEEHKS
ncbi:MAG TPA: hypothetical protein VLF59_00985 [Candidatus Saccharimonadales bacterium]|nr:hypothetical protein [Candidatus Saccharimonadales bacterium]